MREFVGRFRIIKFFFYCTRFNILELFVYVGYIFTKYIIYF